MVLGIDPNTNFVYSLYRESAIDRFSVLFCRIILYMNLKISVDFKNNLTSFLQKYRVNSIFSYYT